MKRDELYESVAKEYNAALSRLARAYEADPEKRRDLLQDIHLQLWRSFEIYDTRCSLRTWVYRVAHHTATSHVIRERRVYSSLVSLEALDHIAVNEPNFDRRNALDRLSDLIRKLNPIDRQVILSYLEGFDASETAEITGLSPPNVAMKVHRIKNLLARQFQQTGGQHAK